MDEVSGGPVAQVIEELGGIAGMQQLIDMAIINLLDHVLNQHPFDRRVFDLNLVHGASLGTNSGTKPSSCRSGCCTRICSICESSRVTR